MLTTLISIALGLYAVDKGLSVSKQLSATKAVSSVTKSIQEAIEEAKQGAAAAVARAKARHEEPEPSANDDLLAAFFESATEEQKRQLIELLSPHAAQARKAA